MNLLVIMNDSKHFKSVEQFFTAEKWQATYAINLANAMANLQKTEFDVILLSWNLNMVDVGKMFEFLDQKLNSMVVVFSEFDKPQILKQLVASRISRTMFPPLSGPGVIKRVTQLLRSRADMVRTSPEEIGVVAISGTEVPSDLQWESAPSPTPGDEKFWQGVSPTDESSTYVYQGQQAPVWEADKKSWSAPGKVYLKVSQEARGVMGSVLGQPIKRKPKVTVLGVDKEIKKYQLPQTNQVDGSLLFYESLSAALEIISAVFCNPNEIQDEMDQITVSWVQSGQLTGLVLAGDPHEKRESLGLMQELQHTLKTEAEGKKEKYELLLNKVGFNIPPTNVTKWAERKTKYVYGVSSPVGKMVMAFIPSESKLDYALDESGQYYAVNVEMALRSCGRAPCDFFVFMKKNQRFVRYITKDGTVSDALISKLLSSQINHILFHKDDLDAFLQHKSKLTLGISK